MSLLTLDRDQFLNRYGKPKTQRQAKVAFTAFDRFLNHSLTSEADLMVRIKKEKPYKTLDHLVQYWKRDKHPTTIRNYFQFVKDWFRFNDITVEDFKVKQYVRFPKPIRDRARGIDRIVIKRMLEYCNPFYKSLLLVLSCTGMRINECLNMDLLWIDFSCEPAKVTIPGQYTKTGQERITFLTPESAKRVQAMCNGGQVFPVNYGAAATYFAGLRKKCGYTQKGTNGFHHVRIHKLRGFTENKVSKAANSEAAHSLLGHTKDLIQYFQGGTTDEEFGQDYEKAIPHLTMESDIILKDENEKLKDKLSRQDELEGKIAKLEDKIKRLALM